MPPITLMQSTLWRTLIESRSFSVIFGVLLLAAAAKISIPIPPFPVPITLGSAAVLLLGFTYTPRAAFDSVAVWLSLAACGLPVIGSPTLLGPSSGYLVGYLMAAPAMAYLLQKSPQPKPSGKRLLFAGLLGNVIIYTLGIAWLTSYRDLAWALQVGFFPFIVSGCCKTLLLVAGVRLVRRQ